MLAKLGVARPAPDRDGLAAVYGAWCRRVPFDNVRKMIHVRAEDPGPLPGDDPTEFFESWLAHGAGGTCWAGNGALFALLQALGFSASRGVATMLVDALEKLAGGRGATSMSVDASDNAQGFFAKRGYTAQQRNSISVNDEWLANTTMKKTLGASQ